ncbi:MAG TPA: putative metallopeptidase [Pyrinomonadaceae bacterium]|jgi:hypothetical protein
MPAINLAKIKRPFPPAKLLSPESPDDFISCQELKSWSTNIFIVEGAQLHIPELAHLTQATIGFLLTNVRCVRQMRPVVGMTKLCRPNPTLDDWAKAQYWHQVRGWFPPDLDQPTYKPPDFLITLYAPYAAECDNASFCALVVHELLHCGVRSYTKKGKAIWGIQGHDVEEHVAVVKYFGVGAAAGRTKELVEVARQKPLFGQARINGTCGTLGCKLLAA